MKPTSFSLKQLLCVLALAGAGWTSGTAAPASGPEASARPQVIALVAAVGGQVTMVRQRQSVGSHLEPFHRQVIPLKGQTLNMAVLNGLDRGIEQDEPQAQRVLLAWNPPEELQARLAELRGPARDDAMLDALIEHLRPMPERQGWDRIEAIMPKYFRAEMRGMGSKLQGIGVYVQPLERQLLDIDGDGNISSSAAVGDDGTGRRVINPRTGAVNNASTYVAPYMYFERVTLDARTLAVLARKQQFDASKYHDPMSNARDVSGHLTPEMLTEKMLALAERSAYQSVRGKGSSVDVSVPVPVAGMPASSPGK